MRSTLFSIPPMYGMIFNSYFFFLAGGFPLHVLQCHSTPCGSLLFWTTLDVLWILYLILWPLMCLKAIDWPNKTCLSETDGKEGCKKKRKLNYFIIFA